MNSVSKLYGSLFSKVSHSTSRMKKSGIFSLVNGDLQKTKSASLARTECAVSKSCVTALSVMVSTNFGSLCSAGRPTLS